MGNLNSKEPLGTSMFSKEEALDKQKIYKEINFFPSQGSEPIVCGFVSEGSNLKSPFLSLYYKHRGLWDFNGGIVFIAKKTVYDEPDNTRNLYYRSYDTNRDKWSVILFDAPTFLEMYHTGLDQHSKRTAEKAKGLVDQWNTLNHNDDEIGERHEVGYEYRLKTLSFARNRVRHKSELVLSLSTWFKTQFENWQANPTCNLHDVMVGCTIYNGTQFRSL